jgi:hypothetical protein
MSLLKSSALAALLVGASALPSAAAVIYALTGNASFGINILDPDGAPIPIYLLDDEGNPVVDGDGNPVIDRFETVEVSLPISFTYTATDFLTGYNLVTPDTCAIGDGSLRLCGQIGFDARALNQEGGTDTFIDFKFENADGSGGGGGFLFFAQGALAAPGVYSNDGFPVNTPGAGNFATATLTVRVTDDEDPSVVPLPAAGWMLVAGMGGLAALRRRHGG